MGIRADGLTKQYGPFSAVEDLDVHVETGERVCVLGPNGSGKTTLLRLLAGLTKPTSGTVTVDGMDYESAARPIRRNLGFVSHETMLYENLSARENLRFHARLRGVPESRVETVLERVDLAHRGSSLPRELSHGMQKRLSLARAELDAPSILLFDEPFSGLDQASVGTLKTLFDDRTIVLATHEFELAFETCDRAVVLSRGSLALDVSTDSMADVDDLRDRYRSVIP